MSEEELDETEVDVPEEEYIAGPSRVFGYEPGSTFSKAIPEPQRTQLIEGGAIMPKDGKHVQVTEPVTPPSPEESAEASSGEQGDGKSDRLRGSSGKSGGKSGQASNGGTDDQKGS